MNDIQFHQNLADGTKGEDAVYKYLVESNSYVEDTRHQKYESGSGPKLRGIEGTVTLPDFVVYDKYKGNYAVDVKVKNSVYAVAGQMCFTVDYKYLHYLKAVELKRLDYLVLAFVYQNQLYWYTNNDLAGTTVFDNHYSRGSVYCFAYDTAKIRPGLQIG